MRLADSILKDRATIVASVFRAAAPLTTISVKQPGKDVITLDVVASDTIDIAKAKIHIKNGNIANKQCVKLGKVELKDDDTLEQAGVEGRVVQLTKPKLVTAKSKATRGLNAGDVD